jgi:S1-C subfamily serine protease
MFEIKPDILNHVKRATIAFGIVDDARNPSKVLDIAGSGFLASPDGYFMTAKHVLEKCNRLAKAYVNGEYKKADLAALVITSNSKTTGFSMIPVDPITKTITIPPTEGKVNVGPEDLDFVVGKILFKGEKKAPFLNIRKRGPIDIYHPVVMCGFPSGDESLDVKKKHLGLRYSPVMQFGMISALLPLDAAFPFYAIQTDIIGVGGSSGSPIFDPLTGEVLGIAQRVIRAYVAGQTEKSGLFAGTVDVGLVYGISYLYMNGMVDGVRDLKEKNKPWSVTVPTLNFTQEIERNVPIDWT